MWGGFGAPRQEQIIGFAQAQLSPSARVVLVFDGPSLPELAQRANARTGTYRARAVRLQNETNIVLDRLVEAGDCPRTIVRYRR